MRQRSSAFYSNNVARKFKAYQYFSLQKFTIWLQGVTTVWIVFYHEIILLIYKWESYLLSNMEGEWTDKNLSPLGTLLFWINA